MLSGPKLRKIQVLSSDVFPTRHAHRMEHMHPNDAKRKMVAFGYICCFSSSSHVSRSDHQKTRARISELKTFEKVRFSVAQTEFCQFEENLQENTATGPFLSFFFAFFHFLSSSSVWHVTVTIWCIFSGFVGASDPGGRQLYVAVSCGGTSLCGYKYFCPVRPSTKFTVSNAAHKAFIVYCKLTVCALDGSYRNLHARRSLWAKLLASIHRASHRPTRSFQKPTRHLLLFTRISPSSRGHQRTTNAPSMHTSATASPVHFVLPRTFASSITQTVNRASQQTSATQKPANVTTASAQTWLPTIRGLKNNPTRNHTQPSLLLS